MRFDVPVEGSWDAMNEACRRAFGLEGSPDVGVYAFQGLANAAWEISLGLARGFPHRRTVAYWLDEGALFEDLAGRLSGDGCTARAVDSTEMRDPKAWLEPMQKDLLLLLDSADDAISGEALESPELEAALSPSRAFRIRISHGRHRFDPLVLASPYEARLCSVDSWLAVAVCGARVKFEAPIARRLSWGVDGAVPTAPEIHARIGAAPIGQIDVDRERLARFEASLPEGARFLPPSPLASACARDRILFYYDDVDGASLLEEAGLALEAVDRTHAKVEAGSGFRWKDPRVFERFLASRGLDRRAARGLIALSPEMAADPGLRAALDGARQRILAIQSGATTRPTSPDTSSAAIRK